MNQALSREPQVLADINTTPLIDVMLVLLIMFIITIPLQSHAVKLDLPKRPPVAEIQPASNTIILTEAGGIIWNDTPLTMPQLAVQLAAVGGMKDQPELHLRPEPKARYNLVDEVLVLTKRAHITRLGFVGNEQFAEF
jgi:biopolymer transport protein ExbD